MNYYYRIWNNEDILENDDKAQTLLLPLESIKNYFLSQMNLSCETICKNSSYILSQIPFNNDFVNVLFLNVKNSGLKRDQYKKRLQISSKINLNHDKCIVVGGYNAGDHNVYAFVELSDFIRRASLGNSYSSFWIDYYQLKKALEKGFNNYKNIHGKNVYLVRDDSLGKMDNAYFNSIINDLLGYQEEMIKEINNYEDLVPFDENTMADSKKGVLLARNSKLKHLALVRENYTCELCGVNKTFETENEEQYFEGHHLIMYNYDVQKRYKYSLDTLENIVCLCPNCHRKIHYSTDSEKRECVLALLVKHNKLFQMFDNLDTEEVINDYIKGVDDNE